MATLVVVEICRVVTQANVVIGYYPAIGLRDIVGPAVTSYSSVMRRTQAQLIADLNRDLTNNFEPGDQIECGWCSTLSSRQRSLAARCAPTWR